METIIAVLIIIVILFLAILKIYTEKKKGAKCIGCPAYKDDNGCCSMKK
ncbi:MAG: FeoB-associated Cys-rich membrane protein [Bacilli bacterium]